MRKDQWANCNSRTYNFRTKDALIRQLFDLAFDKAQQMLISGPVRHFTLILHAQNVSSSVKAITKFRGQKLFKMFDQKNKKIFRQILFTIKSQTLQNHCQFMSGTIST